MTKNFWIRCCSAVLVLMGATALSETPLSNRSAAMLVRLGDRLMQAARDTVAHDFAEAEKAYREALDHDSTNPDALVGMAWVKNSEHDFEAGKKWALKVLEQVPDQPQAHALLADGAMELGRYDEAFGHVQKALDVREDLSSLARASHLMWLTGDPSRAKELMGKAVVAGGPYRENVAWCRSELALMHFHQGELDEARRQVLIAERLAPRNPRVLNMEGRILAAEGDFVRAIDCYERSAAVTPMHESLAALVDLYELNGDTEKARKQKAAVVDFHRDHGHSHAGHSHGHSHGHTHVIGDADLARFMADQGIDPKMAVKEAERAFELYPNVKSADALAWCYFKNDRLKEALSFSDKALKWNSPYPEFHFHRGMILMRMGRENEGRKAIQKAIDMNPRFHPRDSKTARLALD